MHFFRGIISEEKVPDRGFEIEFKLLHWKDDPCIAIISHRRAYSTRSFCLMRLWRLHNPVPFYIAGGYLVFALFLLGMNFYKEAKEEAHIEM